MARDSLAKSAEDLQDELAQLRDDMSALMKTVSRVADNGQREGIAKIKQAGTAATGQARQGIDTAEKTITQNPLISVLVAFGTGLLIGKLVKRG
jgi:ElaB/YqjD/DUF883 family membrane-anchored ribosome-binding protein